MNCQKLTDQIGEIRDMAVDFEANLSLFQVEIALSSHLSLKKNIIEAILGVRERAYEKAYEKWKKYENGELVFEIDVDDINDVFYSEGMDRRWLAHPEGILFLTAFESDVFLTLLKEKSFQGEDISKHLIYYEPYYPDGTSMAGDNLPVVDIKMGPKGFLMRRGQAEDLILLNGKELVADVSNNLDWHPHIQGLVTRSIRSKSGTTFVEEFKLNGRNNIYSFETEFPLDVAKWGASPQGVLIQEDTDIDHYDLWLEEKKILYKGERWREKWQAHPDGFIIIRDKTEIYLNGKELIYISKVPLTSDNFQCYPGGVIVRETDREEDRQYVYRWRYYGK